MASFELDADRFVLGLARALAEERFTPGPWALRTVRDPKLRLIAAPPVADRIVHRALLDDIGPTYERGYLEQCFTCGPGAGAHQAVLAFLGNLRRYGWRSYLDIASYFPSLELDRLEALLFRRLQDVASRRLITRLLNSGARIYRTTPAQKILGPPRPGRHGLPLGSYLSQWCGNLYLDGLDQFVKRELKVAGYLRYMDDFVLFSNQREQLLEAQSAIECWLGRERGLLLNPKHRQIRPSREPATFLGYRISRSGITASRKLRRRFERRVRQAADAGEDKLELCLRSYRGVLLFP